MIITIKKTTTKPFFHNQGKKKILISHDRRPGQFGDFKAQFCASRSSSWRLMSLTQAERSRGAKWSAFDNSKLFTHYIHIRLESLCWHTFNELYVDLFAWQLILNYIKYWVFVFFKKITFPCNHILIMTIWLQSYVEII